MPNPPFTPNEINPSDVALEPVALRAGDSWTWRRVFDGYPPVDGWALQYILNSPTVRFAFPADTITADDDGFTFDVALTSVQTSPVAPGRYDLYAVLTNTADELQQTFQLQAVQVDANLATGASPVDTRSLVKKTLDTLEAAILGDASPTVQEYEIHGRKVRYTDRIQLKQLRDEYKAEYRQEQIAVQRRVTRAKRNVGVSFRYQHTKGDSRWLSYYSDLKDAESFPNQGRLRTPRTMNPAEHDRGNHRWHTESSADSRRRRLDALRPD